jgi:NAD(P)H-dependent FMN reductase
VVLSGLRGSPRAGDQLRVVTTDLRAKAVSDARSVRSQERYFARLAELAKDHFDEVLDETTGETKQCVPMNSERYAWSQTMMLFHAIPCP